MSPKASREKAVSLQERETTHSCPGSATDQLDGLVHLVKRDKTTLWTSWSYFKAQRHGTQASKPAFHEP